MKGQFEKGAAPWNKGIKGSTGLHANCRASQFTKGCRHGAAARNLAPIGTERIDKDGLLIRKVSDDRALSRRQRWAPVHRLAWEAVNGPVPSGYIAVFVAGKATTVASEITADRVEVVSRVELMRRNSRHARYPPELNQIMQLRGALNRKINNRSKA